MYEVKLQNLTIRILLRRLHACIPDYRYSRYRPVYKGSPVYPPRCCSSLTAAIPILSAAGCDVCPVPTALLSAHTRYKTYTFHDTTDILSDYIDAWQKEDVSLDAVYSGFLGNAEQVDLIKRLYSEYPQALRLVDPVMSGTRHIHRSYAMRWAVWQMAQISSCLT